MFPTQLVAQLVLGLILLSTFCQSLRTPSRYQSTTCRKVSQRLPGIYWGNALFDMSGSRATSARTTSLASTKDESVEVNEGFDIAAWFNPNTRGGVIVWSFLLLAIPVAVYNYLVSTGLEDTKVGAYVGALFVLLSNLAWASTYVFRVASKDMTYAKQLRDYENAVLQKRLEELNDDEIDALMAEIESDTPSTPAQLAQDALSKKSDEMNF